MDVTYEDIVEARHEARSNSYSPISHAVLTESAIDSLLEDIGSASAEGSVGRIHQFDVHEGDKNVLVTEDGTEVSL